MKIKFIIVGILFILFFLISYYQIYNTLTITTLIWIPKNITTTKYHTWVIIYILLRNISILLICNVLIYRLFNKYKK